MVFKQIKFFYLMFCWQCFKLYTSYQINAQISLFI